MTRIIAIRPEPGLSATLEAGRARGLDMVGVPLFEIRPLPWDPPEPEDFDGLLIGSANAIRHGGKNLNQFLGLVAHVVGEATEKAVRDFGFDVGVVGKGGLQDVLDRIEPPARLLRISGVERVSLNVPEGITVGTVTAYESVALPLDRAALPSDGTRTVILLHSAIAARHFARECDELGIDRSSLEIAALGPRIASAAGKNWGAIHVSPQPTDADLLALVETLCQ
ncbi:uroporphyrinogen-III synthase [Erythrobacter sp. THAF29]|uniref:uroporphyrinogen-III synthase n=1 Tax=Erythrobacter sp. THAF29 TaxID=2587851 RepID=UPI001267EC0C|nr:uroporphyrinogen-III synthase [Erythrobacter sp. THAF29]QFT78458.1 uroporphyrinogen-III synthase [Erythrobacter sp. THAF29]